MTFQMKTSCPFYQECARYSECMLLSVRSGPYQSDPQTSASQALTL